MLIALVLGGILTGFYLWKRNLVANIFAHFLIDFIPNVLLPLFAGS
jgi:membrane protease YdiL (CAAX protease family)